MRNIKKSFYNYLSEAETPAATPNPPQVKGLVFYKGAQTVAGGTTPTGKGNAIQDNMFGLTEDMVYNMAAKYKFRTDNNRNFQTDLYTYLEKNRPEVIKTMWDNYGTTAQGANIPADQRTIQAFVDGILGARTMYITSILVKEEQKVTPKTQPTTPVDSPMKGFKGENFYGADNKLIGLARYQIRNSTGVKDPGTMQDKNVEFMFVIPNTTTPDESKGFYIIPSTVWSNKITKGVNRILNPQDLAQYKVQDANTAVTSQNVTKANNIPQ